jgi:hypothetical protein
MLAIATTLGDYLAETVVDTSDLAPGSFAGIAAIGDPANAIGLAVNEGKLVLWRRDKKQQNQNLAETPLPKAARTHLRVSAKDGRTFHFTYSPDGKNWTSIGEDQPGDQLPPWDRSIRVGLTAGGAQNAVGKFYSFQMHAAPR